MRTPILDKAFDQEFIEQLRQWTPDAAAMVYDERIRHLEARDKITFAERGLIMLEMEARELWRHVGEFGSLNDWIHNAAPDSNGTCYAALKVARTLQGVIPLDEQNEIPRCNLEVLSKVSSSVAKRPEIRKAAKGSNKEFVAKIQREHPEQHIEAKKPYRFSPDASARTAIDEALDMAMVLEEAASREEALECIASYYADAHRTRYEREKRKDSNVRAMSAAAGMVQ